MFITWSSLFSFSGNNLPHFDIPNLDKLVHFIFYFIAVILGMLFLYERAKKRMKLYRALVICVSGMIAYGIVIEVIQYNFTANRMGDIFDALSNSFGALCGAGVIKLFFSWKGRLNWE